MNIHLVRSTEVDKDLFDNVFEIVGKYQGLLNFLEGESETHFKSDEIERKRFNKGKFRRQEGLIMEYEAQALYSSTMRDWPPQYPDYVNIVSWNSIFEKCNHFRTAKNIHKDELVFLLTDFSNDKNWFSGWDLSGIKNSFVHSGQWEYFLPCDPRFPIAYEVMVTVLQGMLFRDFNDALNQVHKKPRGCINDFCEDKKEVTLKLRTADICTDCQQLLKEKNIDMRIIDQVFSTLDNIRAQMLFRERYKTTLHPSRIEIRGVMKKIYFTDLGDTELKLTPLERTVYLLFLRHSEGLRLSEISNHREWIENTYREIGNSRTVAEFRNSIEQLIDPTENSLSEKISRIKSKIISLAGEDLASHYIIEGARDEKKSIRLDRGLVKTEINK
jgi:hypothetical protein